MAHPCMVPRLPGDLTLLLGSAMRAQDYANAARIRDHPAMQLYLERRRAVDE